MSTVYPLSFSQMFGSAEVDPYLSALQVGGQDLLSTFKYAGEFEPSEKWARIIATGNYLDIIGVLSGYFHQNAEGKEGKGT